MTAKIDGTNGVLQSYDYAAPATSTYSYTFPAGAQTLILVPSGTLTSATITMPGAPADGMVITLSSSQQITALTLQGNAGQSISSAPTYLPAKGVVSYVYRLASTTWYPLQTVPVVAVGVGINQTWQDVTGSRVASTTYTNSTGAPITVLVSCSGSSGSVGLTVGGVSLPTQTVGGAVGFNLIATAVVPSGTTYSMSASAGGIIKWVELR
jgi:hypothetical protein